MPGSFGAEQSERRRGETRLVRLIISLHSNTFGIDGINIITGNEAEKTAKVWRSHVFSPLHHSDQDATCTFMLIYTRAILPS